MRDQRRIGRRIGLFAAADQKIADKVASHLGIFDVVRGSNGETDLVGTRKAAAIREAFGARFAYAGGAEGDEEVLAVAERAIVAGYAPLSRLPPAASGMIEAAFHLPRRSAATWWRAVRPQHWAKNLLVFLAPALGMQLAAWPTALGALILFVAMGCMASAAYIINDIADIPADRAHSRKRFRPFASGEIPISHGAIAAGALALAGIGLGLLLPRAVLIALVAYLVIAVAYSMVFKHQPIIDVVILAGLFTLRVLAGGLIPAAPISPWLLTFAMVFFLGLAMVKRYAELERVARTGGGGVAARGYTEKDLPLLLAAGVAASFGAIIIFMIYLITDQYPRQIYKDPALLWAMLPLILVWILRIWHLAVHGRMNEDPVVFALKDTFSLAVGVILLGVLFAAWS